MARREGILSGGSSGTSVAAALRYARRLTKDDVVVGVICDTGRNYLSKFFDDEWLKANNLLPHELPAHSVGDLVKKRGPRPLVSITPDATAADAIALLQATGISQLPVLRDGQSVGSVQEVTLARLLHDDSDPAKVKVGDVMARPLPQVEALVHLDEAYRLLMSGNTGVLVVGGRQGGGHRDADRFGALLGRDAAEMSRASGLDLRFTASTARRHSHDA